MSFEGNFDVVIEGAGTERGAKVLTAPEGLYVNHHEVPYTTLLGVALRGSILLVVGTQIAMAIRGAKEGLAALAAELRGHADLNHLTVQDRDLLEGERVVFATPVAVSGLADMERIKGMPLAVVTDAALHIFERGGRQFRFAWQFFNKVDVAEAQFGKVLRVAAGTTQLEFLYLTDAQIQTIRGMAARHSGALLGVGESSATATRPPTARPPPPLATRQPTAAAPPPKAQAGAGQPAAAPAPAPPPPLAPISRAAGIEDLDRHFVVPEFELSLGAIGSGADRPLGARVERLQLSPVLPVGFLEEHLRELRTVYEGSLVKRKREAAAAADLSASATALDGNELLEDVRDSVAVIADATIRAFERQARRIAANRRIPWRKARKKYMPSRREMGGIQRRLSRGIVDLEKMAGDVSGSATAVRAAVGGPDLKAAYEGWHTSLRELDQAYAMGWTGVSREVIQVWQDAFLPKLTRLGGERRRLLPRSVRAGLYFLVFAVLGAIAYLAFTGQLSNFIEFQ